MKVTLLGTGAMACLMAYRLAPEAEVTLLGTWREAVEAISARGLVVEDHRGQQVIRMRATTDAGECAGSDLLLILVKSWQTESAATSARTTLADSGLALTLQNGIGNYEVLRALFGVERATAGATTSGATLVAPGHVRMGGEGAFQLGDHPRLGPTQALFEHAGLQVSVGQDRDSILWGKLLVNAAINPLAALLRVPNGELARRPSARVLMEELAREGATVADQAGIVLPYADAAARALEVAQATAHNRSSMLQDVERGRRTEIDAINGAIVIQAQRVGSAAPLNGAAWRLVQALEQHSTE